MRQAEREGTCHRLEELRRCIGKRIASKWPYRDAADALLRAIDRGLAEQHHVAPCEVDVLIRRVECRRLAAEGPMRGRIEVVNAERQPCHRLASTEGLRRKKPIERGK